MLATLPAFQLLTLVELWYWLRCFNCVPKQKQTLLLLRKNTLQKEIECKSQSNIKIATVCTFYSILFLCFSIVPGEQHALAVLWAPGPFCLEGKTDKGGVVREKGQTSQRVTKGHWAGGLTGAGPIAICVWGGGHEEDARGTGCTPDTFPACIRRGGTQPTEIG